MVVGAHQSFQFFKQNTLFLKKFVKGFVWDYLIDIIKL